MMLSAMITNIEENFDNPKYMYSCVDVINSTIKIIEYVYNKVVPYSGL